MLRKHHYLKQDVLGVGLNGNSQLCHSSLLDCVSIVISEGCFSKSKTTLAEENGSGWKLPETSRNTGLWWGTPEILK